METPFNLNKENTDKIYNRIKEKDVNFIFMSIDINTHVVYPFDESPFDNVLWFKINHKYNNIRITKYLVKDLLESNISGKEIDKLKKYLLYLISIIRIMLSRS